jgi:hypothetical protein
MNFLSSWRQPTTKQATKRYVLAAVFLWTKVTIIFFGELKAELLQNGLTYLRMTFLVLYIIILSIFVNQ